MRTKVHLKDPTDLLQKFEAEKSIQKLQTSAGECKLFVYIYSIAIFRILLPMSVNVLKSDLKAQLVTFPNFLNFYNFLGKLCLKK